MSQKEPPNPFEEIQKQLKELFKDSNVSISARKIPNDSATSENSSSDTTDSSSTKNESAETLEKIRNFHLKPKEIRDYLDRFVIRQNDAKKVLSVAICDHYNHVRQSLSGKRTEAVQ